MAIEQTFAIIKPDAVAAGHAGQILAMIEKAGFRIRGMRMTRLSKQQAEGFYDVHRERPFFTGLVAFMTEGAVVVLGVGRAGDRGGGDAVLFQHGGTAVSLKPQPSGRLA